uniref:Major facilitator superfamily (MFS) profile domain-containing protein n=1 Tax=Panagrolaimus superbus TaxID=310955 RepID=A0A914Y2W2_9BILA
MEKKKSGILESFQFLWIHQKYIRYLIATIFLWITDMLLYNAMSLISTSLAGDAYLNYLFSGIIEIPAYTFIPLLINRIGCKKFVIIVHIFTAAALFPILFIQPDFQIIYITFWLLGKLGAAVGIVSLFVYGAEIFPTNIRSTCLGTAAFFGNIGGMISVQTQYLKQINPIFPAAFYSFMSFTAGIITLFLPETVHV